MSAEEANVFRDGEDVQPEVVDHFSATKRAASIVGDLRAALREEGFTQKETFDLIQIYWASELGVIG
ncbi:hypothetical protein [Streptomyces sp. NPDC051546]|uniref:DUF7187 family protein n=1 Tax=Streptomyces sp. NPDC051546 TaxID=3365655 RepID=UPI003799F92F